MHVCFSIRGRHAKTGAHALLTYFCQTAFMRALLMKLWTCNEVHLRTIRVAWPAPPCNFGRMALCSTYEMTHRWYFLAFEFKNSLVHCAAALFAYDLIQQNCRLSTSSSSTLLLRRKFNQVLLNQNSLRSFMVWSFMLWNLWKTRLRSCHVVKISWKFSWKRRSPAGNRHSLALYVHYPKRLSRQPPEVRIWGWNLVGFKMRTEEGG